MSGRISGEDIRLLMDNIGSDDLPDNWQALADAIGIVNVLKLCKSFGGTSLYVPKVDSVIAPAKKNPESKPTQQRKVIDENAFDF